MHNNSLFKYLITLLVLLFMLPAHSGSLDIQDKCSPDGLSINQSESNSEEESTDEEEEDEEPECD